MRRKGTEEPDYTGMPTENPEDSPQEERKWYDKIADLDLKMPYVPRPKGKGARIDFYVESRFPDMALEIKEGNKRKYKNTNDVHREAHYLGMYIIRAIQVSKKRDDLGSVFHALEKSSQRDNVRQALRKEFVIRFESFCTGVISEREFNEDVRTMLEAIKTPKTREWLESEIEKIQSSTHAYDTLSARIRKQKSRANLRVVKGEEE